MMELDERANGRQIELRMGTGLVLRLEENPTTGYRWQVDAAGAPALALGGDRYEPPPRMRAGAPGHHVWTFQAAARQAGVVQLSYRRRFGGVARTFSVRVAVR